MRNIDHWIRISYIKHFSVISDMLYRLLMWMLVAAWVHRLLENRQLFYTSGYQNSLPSTITIYVTFQGGAQFWRWLWMRLWRWTMGYHWFIRAYTVDNCIQRGMSILFIVWFVRRVSDESWRWSRMRPVPILVKRCWAFLPVRCFRLVHHAFHTLSHLT